MASVQTYTVKGEKKEKIALPKHIFDVKVNSPVIAQAIRVYLSDQRVSPAKTKTRAEVSFSTRKIYRQKGTGRARHGSKGAPIFVKGGVAHGPTGEQNYKLKLPQKMKEISLKGVLSQKAQEGEIFIVNDLSKIKAKTKDFQMMLDHILPKKSKKKVTFILPELWENAVRAGRNIANVKFMNASNLNAYQILNGGTLFMAKESLDVLSKKYK